MSQSIVVRSNWDRLRFTCLFELLLLLMLTPVGAIIFERELLDIGGLSLILSIKAMLLNLLYNRVFDSMDVRAGRIPTQRSVSGRVRHAVGFEFMLVLTSLPIVMWWLSLTLGQAFLMDVMISAFVVVYTFVFTWVYDLFYPVEQSLVSSTGV